MPKSGAVDVVFSARPIVEEENCRYGVSKERTVAERFTACLEDFLRQRAAVIDRLWVHVNLQWITSLV